MEKREMDIGHPVGCGLSFRAAYAKPQVEIIAVDHARQLLGTSFYGGHNNGTDEDGGSDHHGGSDQGIEFGAKSINILGQEFVLENPWDK